MNTSVSQSQSSTEMAPAVLKPSINSASNSTLTVTNNTPIMSAKAADIGARDQTRTPTKNYPVALPTLPQLGPHRRIIEESKPNPNQSQPVAPVFPCPLCVGFFFTLAAMKNHLESEHRKYRCDICRKLMSHKRNVDRHRKSVHENQRGFGCPICVYKSAHKQVVQRHLQTKHQIKKEESPIIPYNPTTSTDDTKNGVLDIKPHHFYNYPYYSHPPWVNHHDYNGYYQQQGQYSNYVMDAQHMAMTNQVSMSSDSANQMSMSAANQMTMSQANQVNLNNAGPIVKKNLMLTAAAAPSNTEKTETPMSPMPAVQENLPIPNTMPVVTSASSMAGPSATENSPKTDENANNVQNEASKEPQLSAEVSFEENHVRIVFQRGMSIHVVEVPFPEI